MRPMRVVIADGGLIARPELQAFVERAGFDVVGEGREWAAVADIAVSRAADLVLVAGLAIDEAGERVPVPGIALVPDARAAKEFVASPAFAVVPLDADPDLVVAIATLASARARELNDAHAEIERLRDTLETRKAVERAKGVLMQRLNISEDDAYRRMQRASQQENRKMRDIAESILAAERLYAEPSPGDRSS